MTLSTSTTVPYYYHVAQNSSYDSTRGLLYNWSAVMNGNSSSSAEPSGIQGVCPDGWHVPSHAEFNSLQNYVNSIEAYRCEGTDKYIAQALSGKLYWESYSSDCAVGYSASTHNDATGFNAIPAGYQKAGLEHRHVTYWSSTEANTTYSYYMRFDYAIPIINYSNGNIKNQEGKQHGFSVRCIYDDSVAVSEPTLTTAEASSITSTTATVGGEISYNGGGGITERGVCYSTSNALPTISDTKVVSPTSYPYSNSYSISLTGLSSGTTYYLRAYATNSAGTSYGEVITFTTP